MAWTDVLQAILVLPFTAGNSRTVRNRPLDLDGTSSTVVVRMFFFSLIFLLVTTMTDPEHTLIKFVWVQIFLSIVVSLGLLSCIIAVVVIKIKGFHSIMVPRRDVSTSRFQMTVLWVFGVLSVTFSFLKSGHIVECIHIQGPNFTDDVHVMECVYYGIIFVLLPVQMLTLTYLTPYRFKRSLRIQYMILLVLASNLTMWVYALMDHNTNSKEKLGNDTWHTNCTNLTFTRMLHVSDQILPPIFLEYSMLAITMTQNLSMKWETYNDEREHEDIEIHSLTETNEVITSEESRDSTVQNDAETPLLSGSGTTVKRKQRQSVLFYISFMLSCLVGVSIFIGYIVRVTGHTQITKGWLLCLEFVVAIMMTVCTFTGYFLVTRDTRPPLKSKSISGGEYVFIISAIGALTGSLLRILASIKMEYPSSLFLPSRVMFCILCYLQTVLILHASRCNPKRHHRTTSLKGVLLLLSLYNCGIWIVDSFIIGSHPDLDKAENEILGPAMLKMSHNVCHPLDVFFRFASALELYELYKKFGT